MNYQDISKVNGEINMIDLKGKNYAMVPERVTAFRKLFPDGFIKTEIIAHDGQTVIMQATVGYYENACPVILATGLAYEVKGFGMVNKTSYIENCETSAVGRALGMIGLGINGGGICSAEELANAVVAQGQIKEVEKFENTPVPEGGQVSKQKTLPKEAQNLSPVMNYIRNEIAGIQENLGIDTFDSAKKQVDDFAKALAEGGVIPKFKWNAVTMEEAKAIFAAIRANMPAGDVA
jgi:hypothetical protein